MAGCRCEKAPEKQTATPAPSATHALAAPSSPEGSVAGESSTRSGADPTPAGAEPMVLVKALDFAPVKGSRFLPMKLQQDGLITRKGEPIAKIEGDKLTDDEGRPIASFVAPAQIAIEGSSVSFTFNEKDELEGPDGLKIAVSDSGVPTIVRKVSEPAEQLTGKFVDFDPKTRRAAAILLAVKELKKAAKEARPKHPKSEGEKNHEKNHKKSKKKG